MSDMVGEDARPRVALLFCNLRLGGIQRSMLNLATAFLREGVEVDLVVQTARGELAGLLPEGVRLFQLVPVAEPDRGSLPRSRAAQRLVEKVTARAAAGTETVRRELCFLELVPSLLDYLNRQRPQALMAAEARFNVMALVARELADHPMPVITSERTNLDETHTALWRDPALAGAMVDLIRSADMIGGVSEGVCAQLRARGMPDERVRVVNSPVLAADFARATASEPPHAWMRPDAPPVVLSVGRIHPLKDLETILRSFAQVAAERPARLILIGGPDDSRLCNEYFARLPQLAQELGVDRHVAFLGMREDPFPFFAHAGVFVLSSRYEGIAGTIVQALGCGCPVVSTDCPHGPAEVLDGGRFGRLVPIGDADAMARAIEETLAQRPERAPLQARAECYTAEAAADLLLSSFPTLRPQAGGIGRSAAIACEPQAARHCEGAPQRAAPRPRRGHGGAGMHAAPLRNWLVRRIVRNGRGGTPADGPVGTLPLAMLPTRGRIGLLFCYLGEGGIERNRLRLAEAFLARGFDVDLLIGSDQRTGDHVIPAGATATVLERAPMDIALRVLLAGAEPRAAYKLLWPRLKNGRSLRFRQKGPLGNGTIVPHLVRYIRERAPLGIVAAEPSFGVPAIWARDAAGRPCRIIISEHNAPLEHVQSFWREAKYRPVALSAYARADAVVGVSSGISRDLVELGIAGGLVHTIYNPVVSQSLVDRAKAPPPHEWFRDSTRPVVVAVGRLRPQKDFATLLRAFALVRQSINARLIVVGGVQGRSDVEQYYAEMQNLVEELRIGEDVEFVGYQANPFAFMSHAALFVLSSAHEGLPTVLIEAMACGTPVVSTDCPHGPSEILEQGRYGPLVPVGVVPAMAAAIRAQLAQPTLPSLLEHRAAHFSLDAAAESYLDLLQPQRAIAA